MQFSFDVFDTAVCRLIHSPEHIHLVVRRKLRHRGIVNLSDIEWMYVGTQAEFQQRLTVPRREATLDEIYERLSRSLNLVHGFYCAVEGAPGADARFEEHRPNHQVDGAYRVKAKETGSAPNGTSFTKRSVNSEC